MDRISSSLCPAGQKIRQPAFNWILLVRSNRCESKAVLVEIARLLGVSNVDFHIVDSFDRENLRFHASQRILWFGLLAINSFPQKAAGSEVKPARRCVMATDYDFQENSERVSRPPEVNPRERNAQRSKSQASIPESS